MQEDVKEEDVKKEKKEKPFFLVIHNDDVNSFQYVTHLLVNICGLDRIQAEQCMLISHHKGKCEVKHGDKEELTKLQDRLIRKGLGASVE